MRDSVEMPSQQHGSKTYLEVVYPGGRYAFYAVVRYPDGSKPDTLAGFTKSKPYSDPCVQASHKIDYYWNGRYTQSGDGILPTNAIDIIATSYEGLDTDILVIRK